MKGKILSLLLVLLMLLTASVAVNKSLFGHPAYSTLNASDQSSESKDSIISIRDGREIVHTANIPGTLIGYGGPVPVDIYIAEGKIHDIKILPNSETPSFLERADKVVDRWIGMTPEEAMDTKVDAVSGATYTSLAIINNVDLGLSYYRGSKKNATSDIPWKIWVALAVTLTACIVPLFVKNKIYHNIQLLANVIVLGFWCGQFLDFTLILKYISDGISLPLGLTAIVMLISAFIYPLFGHPQHYCNHVCPFGSMQHLLGEICGYKLHISTKVLKGLDWFRKILWALLMLLLWTDTLTEWMDLELFQAFQVEAASWGIIITAAVFMLLSLIVNRPYCRFVCPTGSLFKRAENIG